MLQLSDLTVEIVVTDIVSCSWKLGFYEPNVVLKSVFFSHLFLNFSIIIVSHLLRYLQLECCKTSRKLSFLLKDLLAFIKLWYGIAVS